MLVFRKPGEHEHPVKCTISVDTWQQYASPVWMDIDYGNTLNGTKARSENDEKHICLAEGTLVLTKRGYIPIESVKIGDETLTHTGSWKNPVTEMQRTKALGLLHKQVKKDAAMSRVGIPDYLLVFRKPGEHEHPVKCNISVDTWQQYASPVWMDIDYSNTLNGTKARGENDEKHICPLQLDTIKRAVTLWSNEGDTVFTPFLGIGSEVYQSILLKRFGIGFELKESYFNEAIKNCKVAEVESNTKKLFDV